MCEPDLRQRRSAAGQTVVACIQQSRDIGTAAAARGEHQALPLARELNNEDSGSEYSLGAERLISRVRE